MHHLTEMRTLIEVTGGIIVFLLGILLSPVVLARFFTPLPVPTPAPEPKPDNPKFNIAVTVENGKRVVVAATTINNYGDGHLDLSIDGKVCAMFAAKRWLYLEVESKVTEEAKKEVTEKKADESATQSGI